MKKTTLFNILVFIILIISYNIINDYNYFFHFIYICLLLYHFYILYLSRKYLKRNKLKIFISIIIYPFTYYFICDPNPIFCFLTYYIFYPNIFKAILIIFIHTFILSKFPIIKIKSRNNPEGIPLKEKLFFPKKKNL